MDLERAVASIEIKTYLTNAKLHDIVLLQHYVCFRSPATLTSTASSCCCSTTCASTYKMYHIVYNILYKMYNIVYSTSTSPT